MATIGVPTLLSAQRLLDTTASLRRQADVARTELTTGRRVDLPAALGPDIGAAFALRATIDAIGLRRQGLDIAAAASGITQRALAALGEGGRDVATNALAANARGDNAALATAAVEARAKLADAVGSLNTRFAGQALFAGDATDQDALVGAGKLLADVSALYAAAPDAAAFNAALDAYFDDPAGGFQTEVYAGGAGSAPSVELAPGERVAVNARADERPIRDLVRGLSIIAVAGAAPASGLREGALFAASSATLDGVDGLIARRAEIGVAEQRIAQTLSLLEAEEATLTEAYNAKTARDPFEAAVRLQALETQLGAALTLTARISQLTLTNFLR